ncbi:hypothetical protein JCM10450v2_001508 [Rhodotorula kratochvilovae]
MAQPPAPASAASTAFAHLDRLNTLIANNSPPQRSDVRQFFHSALRAVFDLGATTAERLDGVPVVEEWLPAAKVVFWLGVVYFHRKEAREACHAFATLLADGYGVAVQLGLGSETYARNVMDDVALAFLAYADKRKLSEKMEGGVRKVWYETRNAFGRENVVGTIKQLTEWLNTRCSLLTLMLVQSQHELTTTRRFNVPLDAPKPPPDPFLGRADSLALIAGQLRGKSLLVQGILGIGKTSLVRKALQDVYPDMRQVVLRCDGIKSVEKLERELLRVHPERPLEGEAIDIALRVALGECSTVVVLDNIGAVWVRDPDGVEELLQSLMSLASVTLLLTAPDETLYNALADPDVAAISLDPLNEADRCALFLHFAPQHQDDPHLAEFLAEIGGQPLVIRDEAIRSRSHASLKSMLDEWVAHNRVSSTAIGPTGGQLATSVALALKQLRQVPTASELVVLLARLPYGLDVGRLSQRLFGDAIAALTSKTGLAAFGSETLRLFPPVRECLERDHAKLLKAPLSTALLDALVASFTGDAHELLAAKMQPRRCNQPLVPPASADWPNFPRLLELALECGSKQLDKLADAVQELLETLPLPGELADFLCATQDELEEQFGKVVERLAIKERPTPFSALASASVALVLPSRQLAALRDWPLGGLVNKSWQASPGPWIEKKVLGPPAPRRLEVLLRFQLAKWSGTERDLAQAARDLEILGSKSLLGWAAFERSAALVSEILAPRAPASLKDVHQRERLFYPVPEPEVTAEEAGRFGKVLRPKKSLAEEKLVRKVFDALEKAYPYLAYHRSTHHAKRALDLYVAHKDADGLVMLIRYIQTCAVAAAPSHEEHTEKLKRFELFFEIIDALRKLHPPEAHLRAVQDCLGLEDKEVGLPPRAPASPASPKSPAHLRVTQPHASTSGQRGEAAETRREAFPGLEEEGWGFA